MSGWFSFLTGWLISELVCSERNTPEKVDYEDDVTVDNGKLIRTEVGNTGHGYQCIKKLDFEQMSKRTDVKFEYIKDDDVLVDWDSLVPFDPTSVIISPSILRGILGAPPPHLEGNKSGDLDFIKFYYFSGKIPPPF